MQHNRIPPVSDVVRYLRSPAGIRWQKTHFHAIGHHALIELSDDRTSTNGRTHSDDSMLELHRRVPGYENLAWSPDQPPEGGKPF